VKNSNQSLYAHYNGATFVIDENGKFKWTVIFNPLEFKKDVIVEQLSKVFLLSLVIA